jgi:hypothetical protein
MLSPDTETRMLLATNLHGDNALEGLKNQVMDVAARTAGSLSDHPLTSEVVLALYEHGFGAGTEADLRRLFGDLFRAFGPSGFERRGKIRVLPSVASQPLE